MAQQPVGLDFPKSPFAPAPNLVAQARLLTRVESTLE